MLLSKKLWINFIKNVQEKIVFLSYFRSYSGHLADNCTRYIEKNNCLP